jgi:two-component system, chemotaxis family, sensor kinase CheA
VPLIVRGMSRSTGKLVKLDIEAGTAELDKSVGERVFPAIVHLVRNAIDHAIESPEERRAANKPEQGLIKVYCFEHSNSELEVRVTDDGRGIDAGRVAQKAQRPLPRNDRELLDLITLPGLSSLDHATSNSGRGMGMDIVKRIVVETLGGSLSVETEAQRGTTFTLRIPLSISIVDSFSFACGGETFVVPVSMIEEIIEVESSNVTAPPAPNGNANIKLIERRGRAVPLLALAELFKLKQSAISSKALVIRRGEEPFAFAVERMFGQQEIVVRPLEDPLVKVTGISGATDLGDGKPTLVLDLVSLAAVAGHARGVNV